MMKHVLMHLFAWDSAWCLQQQSYTNEYLTYYAYSFVVGFNSANGFLFSILYLYRQNIVSSCQQQESVHLAMCKIARSHNQIPTLHVSLPAQPEELLDEQLGFTDYWSSMLQILAETALCWGAFSRAHDNGTSVRRDE